MSLSKRIAFAFSSIAVSLALLGGIASSASAAAVWDVHAAWGPTNLVPGEPGQFLLVARNLGDAPSTGAAVLTEELPPGVHAEGIPNGCSSATNAGVDTITCSVESVPHRQILGAPWGARHLLVDVSVDPGAALGVADNTLSISGGGAAQSDTETQPVNISNDPTGFGLIPEGFSAGAFDAQFPAGEAVQQAGSHPFELRVEFDFTKELDQESNQTEPVESVRTVEVTLPRGLVGNPEATPKCQASDFFVNVSPQSTGCPPETQVGTLTIHTSGASGEEAGFTPRVAVYNVKPRRGIPADFAFNAVGYTGHIEPTLDPANGYRIKATTPYISALLAVRWVEFTMWGVPADPAHDLFRADPSSSASDIGGKFGASSTGPIEPLLTAPMDCGFDNGDFDFRAESWQHPGSFVEYADGGPFHVVGCDDPRIRFEPDVSLQPTSRSAGSPTGLDVRLEFPQRDQTVNDPAKLYAENGNVHGIDTPPVKKAVVTLPEGMTISTSAAQGLGSCTPAQIGLGNDNPVACPDDSQYGSLTLYTPILPVDQPMKGQIFIAKQNENPFNDFLAMYFVIEEPERGLRVKLPGRIALDPVSGQIKTTFDDLPQFPVSEMQLAFKGGVRAALVNPSTCGNKTIEATFYSWHAPDTPVSRTSSYPVTQKPDGSPCVNDLAERPFNPELSAGAVSNSAGTYSPFVFRLQRSDDDQEFSQLGVTLPPGLLANISNLTECPEASIAQASAPDRTGGAEALFPSCPASSQIGTTDVGSGVGQVITYIPGKAYLAGPYKGAPLSMVVITPILAGPYDLGVIAVRSAIHVDPQTAQARIQTEPFPQIYEGIPVRLRDIRVNADRPNTMINPTNCAPMAVGAHVTGTGGNLASTADDTAVDLSSRFQAANCGALPFEPKLSFKLRGGTKRGQFPALEATLKARPGDANIARTTVVLPRSEFIEQGHIVTVCTRPQFAADQCPAGSVYGTAEAKSPLFDETLKGPVYLRSNGGERLLPDLVVSLDGKIDVALAGFIDSVKGRVRNAFNVIPDAPVTEFKLKMQGGKRGLLVNHLNLCKVTSRADVKLVGQNGKVSETRPKMGTSCKKQRKAVKPGKTKTKGASR